MPCKRNILKILGLGQAYAEDILNNFYEKFVLIDETGFNLQIFSDYGFSQKTPKYVHFFLLIRVKT